ncbi:hypothetical protein POTOM_005152 [Populus tomentosa]|uniref:Uncharacterized protein n=1 Tax=Populus tomentosa TaxID=118781 RepID=A0A8X8AGT9_POPTO|nr:hypothetical protein POTOM_005152 [Populus tomentosa]
MALLRRYSESQEVERASTISDGKEQNSKEAVIYNNHSIRFFDQESNITVSFSTSLGGLVMSLRSQERNIRESVFYMYEERHYKDLKKERIRRLKRGTLKEEAQHLALARYIQRHLNVKDRSESSLKRAAVRSLCLNAKTEYSSFLDNILVVSLSIGLAPVDNGTCRPFELLNTQQKHIFVLLHPVTDGTFMEEPGSGAVATIENKVVSIGTLDWIQRHGVDEKPFQEVEDLKNQSVVYVGVDNTLAGLIYFEDQIREDARQVVESLSCQGINVYMLSGDKKSTAEHVASLVGIPKEKVLSGVKPDEKKKFISELQKDQSIVAMVGDGINDAAALAESHVGVAMGGGVGAASEVSSIVLMGNRLSQVFERRT